MPVNDFKWIEDIPGFDKSFIKSYNKVKDEVYFHEVDVQYSGKLHDLQNDLPFISERMEIVKVEKLVANLYDKTETRLETHELEKPLAK